MRTALDHYYEVPDVNVAKIKLWLDGLTPVTPDGSLWSCHAVCRAAHRKFELSDWRVIDGFFKQRGNCHCWLQHYNSEGKPDFVLDVYPIASHGTPLLVDVGSWRSPWYDMYIPESPYFNKRTIAFEAEALILLGKVGV